MNRVLQKTLLSLHGAVRRSGLLSTRPGRHLFEIGYEFYKARFEAGEIAGLRHHVRPDAMVLDIGANIGFFTTRFARWVSGTGRVLALEPETENHHRLERRLAVTGLADRVEVLRAAAAEREGWAHLLVNPHHPGDHRLVGAAGNDGDATGEPVPLVTVDGLLAERGHPPVSLIKIDVQGAEPRVIMGAHETLRRDAPAVWMEVDPVAMDRVGGTPRALLDQMAAVGYHPHRPSRSGVGPALSVERAMGVVNARGYADFLFLARS